MKSHLPFLMVAAAAIAITGAVEYRRPFNSIKATKEIIENYEVIRPIITMTDSNLPYPKILEVMVPTQHKNFSLELHMNQNIISGGFTSIYFDQDGQVVKDKNHYLNCYYHGTVRGHPDWTVLLTNCHGLQGEFGELGNKENYYHLEPLDKNNPLVDQLHAFYKDSEYKTKRGSCDYIKDHGAIPKTGAILSSTFRKNERVRRESNTRIVEWVVVSDDAQYTTNGRNLTATVQRAINIANGMDPLYQRLTPSIRISLTGAITFTAGNRFNVTSNATILINRFRDYVVDNLTSLHHDSIMLLTGLDLDGDTVGVAFLGTMCSVNDSVGLSQDGGIALSEIVATATHELGHIFNMDHDRDFCPCPDPQGCIMAPFSINPPPTTFSNCSKFDFGSFIDLNGDFCLFNTPNTNVADERCGNGVQESNEACDCGDIEECTDQCCNATICQLARGVQCSAGPCCDSQCRFKPSTSQCRARSEECDIEEHCTGASNACPEDIYVVDGTSCASDTGYCAEGKCPTHTAQCMAAWNSTESSMNCFQTNIYGDQFGNCGHNSSGYLACQSSDSLCGQLQCSNGTYQNIYKVFGDPFTSKSDSEYCSTFIVPITSAKPNPGLVAFGTKCGDGMLCLSQQCVPISNLNRPTCPVGSNGLTCSGNSSGICNNLGQCSCLAGFSGSTCGSSQTTITTIGMTTTLSETVQQNTVVVTLMEFTVETFNVTRQAQFISALVLAINSYCQDDDNEECAFTTLVKRNSPVTAADITITNIINATSGNGIQFEIFVRGMGGDSVLSQQQLLTALRAYSSTLQDAGFQATFTVLVEMTTPPPQVSTKKLAIKYTVGIIIATLVAATILFVIGAIVIYSCFSKRCNCTYGTSRSTQSNQKELSGGETVEENLIQTNPQSKDKQSNLYSALTTETSMHNMQMDEGPGEGMKAQ